MPKPPANDRTQGTIALTTFLLLLLALTGSAGAATDGGDNPRLRDRFAELAVSDELPTGLSLRAFERSLEGRYFGTFVFYQSLGHDDREKVYESYRSDPHIAAIRTTTLELLK
jgi:hypothetical protein